MRSLAERVRAWWAGGGGTAGPRGCRTCGVCCDLFGGNLRTSRRDVDRWRAAGREDLVARVGPRGRLWMDPETGRFLTKCPFLASVARNRLCRIHALKPDMCRDYPTLAHGRQCVKGVVFH